MPKRFRHDDFHSDSAYDIPAGLTYTEAEAMLEGIVPNDEPTRSTRIGATTIDTMNKYLHATTPQETILDTSLTPDEEAGGVTEKQAGTPSALKAFPQGKNLGTN